MKLARSLNVPEAGFLLGKIYLNGIGTIPDLEISRSYFKELIKQHSSNPDAFEFVAKAHYYSGLLSFDETEREHYLRETANLSYPKAQFIYGMRLLEPNLPTECYNTGKDFIIKAAEQNYAPAKKQIKKMEKLKHKRNH